MVVGVDGAATGLPVAGDEHREGWAPVVTELAANRRVVVITGDSEAAASTLAEHPAVDEVLTNVPPEVKTAVVEALRPDSTVAMLGDGSNNPPSRAPADVGLAIEEGTRLAANAADAVIVTDDLHAVPRVFDLTSATRRRIRENQGPGIPLRRRGVAAGAGRAHQPAVRAVAMATSSLLVVANSARSLG